MDIEDFSGVQHLFHLNIFEGVGRFCVYFYLNILYIHVTIFYISNNIGTVLDFWEIFLIYLKIASVCGKCTRRSGQIYGVVIRMNGKILFSYQKRLRFKPNPILPFERHHAHHRPREI